MCDFWNNTLREQNRHLHTAAYNVHSFVVHRASQLFGDNHFLCDFYRHNLHGEQAKNATASQPASRHHTRRAKSTLNEQDDCWNQWIQQWNYIVFSSCVFDYIWAVALWRFVCACELFWSVCVCVMCLVCKLCVAMWYCHGCAVVKGVYDATRRGTFIHIWKKKKKKRIVYTDGIWFSTLCVIFGVSIVSLNGRKSS